jgi:hypothetical protein
MTTIHAVKRREGVYVLRGSKAFSRHLPHYRERSISPSSVLVSLPIGIESPYLHHPYPRSGSLLVHRQKESLIEYGTEESSTPVSDNTKRSIEPNAAEPMTFNASKY